MAEFGGQAAVIRHEYAHYLWERRLSSSFKQEFVASLPSSEEVTAGLTRYAGVNRAQKPDEVFTELFATVTNPDYDKAVFPQWVQDLGDKIITEVLK